MAMAVSAFAGLRDRKVDCHVEVRNGQTCNMTQDLRPMTNSLLVMSPPSGGARQLENVIIFQAMNSHLQ